MEQSVTINISGGINTEIPAGHDVINGITKETTIKLHIKPTASPIDDDEIIYAPEVTMEAPDGFEFSMSDIFVDDSTGNLVMVLGVGGNSGGIIT